MTEHKEICLGINCAQSVRLEKETIKFKNYFKQIPVPFKIFSDFEYNLRCAKIYEGSYSKKYQKHIPYSFAYKVVCTDGRFSKTMLFLKVKILHMKLLKQVLKSMSTSKK